VLAEPPHELDQRACLCTRAFSQPLNPSPTNPIPFRACADMALVPFGSTGTGPTDRLCRKAMQKVPGGTHWGLVVLAGRQAPPRMARLHNAPTHPTRMRASLGSRLRRRSVSSAALRCARHQRQARRAAARPSSHPLAASTAGICIVRIASTLCPRGSPVGSADGPTPDKRTRRMEPTCGDQVLLVTGLCVRVCGREGVCVSDEHSAILSVSEANTQKRAPAVAGGAPFGRARRRRTQRAAGG
jgi:hypothetical protein